MLGNIFHGQNISSPLRNLFNKLAQKTVNQQLMSNPIEKISHAVDSSIDEGVQKVKKIMGDSDELIRTPAKWLKDMQRSWLVYVVSMAIICLCLLIFYCACRGYCSRRGRTNRLKEITMILAKSNGTGVNKY